MMQALGSTERRALAVVGMSASALRYQPAPDRNTDLRQQIVTLAQRHRRYGAEMIYLKLRQAGQVVNHKRVERLYALEKLQVRRRRLVLRTRRLVGPALGLFGSGTFHVAARHGGSVRSLRASCPCASDSLFIRSKALAPCSEEGPTPCLNRYRNT